MTYTLQDWQTIHPNFTEELRQEWTNLLGGYYKEKEKAYQTTQTWMMVGLEPQEAKFARWLENKDYISNEKQRIKGWQGEKQKLFNPNQKETLKLEYLNDKWASTIHPEFAEKKHKHNKTYQQLWEENGLTYQDAQEWTQIDFEPRDYKKISQWKKCNFTPQEVKSWIIDLKEDDDDYESFAYLRYKGYQPNSNLSPEELGKLGKECSNWEKKDKPAQEYFDILYPQEKRKEITKLNISRGKISKKSLTDSLDLSDFINLKEFICSKNKLTSLDLTACPNLQKIDCSENQLIEIRLPKGEKLEELNLNYNNFNQGLAFLKDCVNLKELGLGKNGFYDSLEPLKNMSKLKELFINDTDINSGLEYLPDNLKYFSCSPYRKDAKVKVIEEEFKHFNKDLKKLKEFNNVARKYLDENYVESKREEITELDISYEKINEHKEENKKTTLKGGLWLKEFANLRVLNCSGHQLTDLDLSDCSELIELNCSNNEVKSLEFLKNLPNPEKLEILWIQNNPNLVAKNLDILSNFTNLEELDISNCPKIKGSLKSLENMKDLEKVSISGTDVGEGLEYLPESCKELNCNLDYDYSSVEVAKQLSKFSQGEGKYDLDKWRVDKANNATASIIPLERLFVIRSNIKQFANKWGKKENQENNPNLEPKSKLSKIIDSMKQLEDKVIAYRQGGVIITQPIENNQPTNHQNTNTSSKRLKNNSLTELEQLRSPEQYSKYRYLGGTKWIARATAATGGILALTGFPEVGGSMAAASPFVDAVSSHVEDNYYTKKEEKWKEFLNDADTLLDNFHELLGITKSIKIGELGKVNEVFKELKKEVDAFLKEFDEDGNGEIDVKELIDKREKLFKPDYEAHEYTVTIEDQFFEQFAQTQHQASSFWNKLPWNKNN